MATSGSPALIAGLQGENNFVEVMDSAGTRWRLMSGVNGLFFADQAGNPVGSGLRKIAAKTADYTVTLADNGTVFTNTGAAGAVNFTLPAVAGNTGYHFEFFVTAGQTITITAPAGKLIAYNNAAATSLAFSTAAEKIGGMCEIVGDGSFWYAIVGLGFESQTIVIA